MTESSGCESGGLTPQQRVDPPTPDPAIITAGIVTIQDMAVLRACVGYENQHKQRVHILRRLDRRAAEIRSDAE